MHAGTAIEPHEPKAAERVGRYLTRAPVALGDVHPQKDGRVKLLTPPDPKTGRNQRFFDLDWVHAVTTQIPDPRKRLVRYGGPGTRGFALATPVTPSLPSWCS